MAVLACLARRPGEVVSKDELLAEVWPDSHVEDVALARSISEIRRVLRDDARDPKYVETLAKRGYRLVADVHMAQRPEIPPAAGGRWPRALAAAAAVLLVVVAWAVFGPDRASEPPPGPPPAAPLSIAVLPFENYGGSADDDYLAEALTEDVTATLSEAASLRVISRTSTTAYRDAPRNVREIGAALGVSAVLEGSMRREAGHLVVVGQLIDTATDEHLWAETIERDARDLRAVQREIAEQIATALHVRLAPVPEAADNDLPDPEVYDLFLRGRAEYIRRNPATLPDAVEMLREVTERAPDFALGHAALADALARTFQDTREGPAIQAALDAANRALELDPDLAEGHKALGMSWAVIGRYRLAAESYERAVARRPSYMAAVNNLAIVFYTTGQLDRAYRWMREAVLIDPASPVTRSNFGETLAALTFDEEAKEWLDYALTVEPHNQSALDILTALDLYAGRLEDGRRRMAQELASDEDCRPCLHQLALIAMLEDRNEDAVPYLDRILGIPGIRAPARIWKGHIRRGDGPPARDPDLATMVTEFSLYVRDGDESPATRRAMAAAEAVQGNDEQAIEWYTRAIDAGHWNYRQDEIDPAFDRLRNDPRFQAQLQRARDRVADARAAVTQVMRPGGR